MSNNKELVGTGVKFERIRRITGYLVGTLDRFNDAKRAEVAERIPHSLGQFEKGEKNETTCVSNEQREFEKI